MTPALELSTVGLRLGSGAERLDDISLRLPAGSVGTVVGPAGSGKSLLLAIAALEQRPSRGSVRLFGREANSGDAVMRAAARRRIGWVEAEPILVATLDAVDNAALPLRLAGTEREEARARASELLAWLGEPVPLGSTLAPELRHRVAIARAVLAGQELILVDEVAALPPALAERFITLVTQLSRTGTAFLLTSRDERVLARFPATPSWHLLGGRLQVIDSPAAERL